MIYQTLQELGYDKKEIEMYLQLLKIGPGRASTLAYQLAMPRTSAQNILGRLEQKELVTKSWQQNVAIFNPVHPDELKEMVEVKRRKKDLQYQKILEDLNFIIPELKEKTLSQKVPNVKFYKGLDGVRKVLFDTLKSKTELKDFANIDSMFQHVQEINDEYVAEREKTAVTKRSLLLDTEFARQVYESGKYSPKSHKGYKWIDKNLYPFTIEMNIYDGKVSYLTYVEDDFIGVIIENDYIYQMHNSMWDLIWDLLPEVKVK